MSSHTYLAFNSFKLNLSSCNLQGLGYTHVVLFPNLYLSIFFLHCHIHFASTTSSNSFQVSIFLSRKLYFSDIKTCSLSHFFSCDLFNSLTSFPLFNNRSLLDSSRSFISFFTLQSGLLSLPSSSGSSCIPFNLRSTSSGTISGYSLYYF